MCGIAVMLGFNGKPADQAVVEPMTASLFHRGPDEDGFYGAGSVGLGFRRLAILDLTDAAHQPMVSVDGQHVIVFNGEIFNYVELRNELQSLGHRFRSTGDTEVLLTAYRQWGQDCLSRLNGMWAFVIYDRKRGRLFGSRDRFGIKPLYYHRDKSSILFASEIKAIRASGLYRGGINWSVAASFLLEGQLDETNDSFFSDIEQVPAGSAFEVDLEGTWKYWRYWSLLQAPSVEIKDPVHEVMALFEDSVRLHMRSDVPVDVALSGGIDSTAIICAAARQRGEAARGEPLHAFSFVPEEFDESKYIADTLAMTQARLIELQTTPRELWDKLPSVLWYQDEPVHTMTALVSFELMRCVAGNGIRVVLNGQGGDETMGGYSSYFLDYWTTLVHQGQIDRAWREVRAFTAVHGGEPIKALAAALLRALAWECHRIPAYHRFSTVRNHNQLQRNAWFTNDLTRYLALKRSRPLDGTLNAHLARSITSAPLPLYLRIEDRNSMAHSVEMRLPFLDHRLVSLLFNLPEEWKIRGPWNKYVFREAMRQRIPESVRTRADKLGFATPVGKWVANDLYEPMADLLGSQVVRERGLYNTDAVIRDLQKHRNGEIGQNFHGLFNVVQFEMWMKMLNDDASLCPTLVSAVCRKNWS